MSANIKFEEIQNGFGEGGENATGISRTLDEVGREMSVEEMVDVEMKTSNCPS
jgi:hypothetical protein